jgi:hypothetical protein
MNSNLVKTKKFLLFLYGVKEKIKKIFNLLARPAEILFSFFTRELTLKNFFKQVKAEKEEENKPESLFLKILEEERTIIIKKGELK